MSLFDLTESIVNISNEEEARNKLLDSNVLLLNNQEYYKTIISSFIQKKESIIRKENNKLVFDLNNTDDIWNIVFIGEYIKENDILYKTYNKLLVKINEIECALSLIKDKHKTATSQEVHKLINEEYQKVNNELNTYKNQINNMKSVIDSFYNTDWVNLNNSNESIDSRKETAVLKQAINIIHKVRNSFEHDNPSIDSNIHINNDYFNFSIPIEYLDGFNKGRIIANNKDDVIVEKTNLITLPLLEELNCDINDIQSLFYNLDPELLSMLLKETNYNVKDIFRLSKGVLFEHGPRTKEILKAGFGFDIIEKISYVVSWDLFLSTEQIIDTLNYLKVNNLLDKYILTNPNVYKNVQALDLYIKNGIELEVLNIDNIYFYDNIDNAYRFIEIKNRLEQNGISFNRLVKRFSEQKYAVNNIFETSEQIIEVKHYLDENNIPSEVLYDEKILIEEFFKNPEKFKKIINSSNANTFIIRPIIWYTNIPGKESTEINDWIVNYLKNYGIDSKLIGIQNESFESLKTHLIERKLYPYKEEFKELYIILEYLRIMNYSEKYGKNTDDNILIYKGVSELFNADFSIEDIEKLSISAITNYQTFIYFKNNNIPMDLINRSQFFILERPQEVVELFIYLKDNNIPISSIKYDIWHYPYSVIKFFESIPKDKFDVINNLSNALIFDTENTIKNINYLINNNIDVLKIPRSLIEGGDNTIKFIEWFKNNNYDLKIIEKIPNIAFIGFSKKNAIGPDYIFYEELKKLKELESTEYGLLIVKSIIEIFIKNGYKSNEIMPKKVFSIGQFKKENIEYLLKLVNFDFKKLDEFPVEFYTCDYELLDTMCKKYNYNLCKSIFGLDNPKIIMSLIYGNSVYSQYQKELDDNSLVDIDPMTIIHAGFNTTMYYKNNIKNNDFNEELYLKQFMYDENNQKRSNEDLKKYVLDKLRNSLASS